jgi:hypothetical protein
MLLASPEGRGLRKSRLLCFPEFASPFQIMEFHLAAKPLLQADKRVLGLEEFLQLPLMV